MFFKKNQTETLSQRGLIERKYASGRWNLLIVVLFTVVNMLMLAFGGSTYFLFSATGPYYALLFGMDLTGRMPDEYYMTEDGEILKLNFPDAIFYVMLAFALCCIALYLVCFLLSKKHPAFMAVAIGLFGIDCVALVLLTLIRFLNFSIIDFIFHGIVLVYLINGAVAGFKLRKLPPEPAFTGESMEVPEVVLSGNTVPETSDAKENASIEVPSAEPEALSEPSDDSSGQ